MATGSPLPTFLSLPLPIIQLSLPAVLKCGQSFRWSLVPVAGDTEYRLCLRDRVVCLRQSPTNLLYRAMFPDPQPSPTEKALKDKETLAWLNDYFQLDVDLAALYKQWSEQDQVFARVQHRFQGIRILRQDPWENLVSYVPRYFIVRNVYRDNLPRFICSSNNNISRITRMVEALCSHYSPSLLSFPGEETAYHPFPPPSVLAQPGVSATLRSLGFGYRADFINRTAKALVDTHGKISSESLEASEKWLLKLRDSNTESARKELLQFTGVGRKVADCVLLMSLDKVFEIYIHQPHLTNRVHRRRSYRWTHMCSKSQLTITG